MDNSKLADVFALIKQLAIALRMNSDYSSDPKPQASTDVMWLSDALHNFDCIEEALLDPNTTNQKLNSLISTYKEYLESRGHYKSVAIHTFDRWNIDIAGAVKLLESLKKS
jgi:hypothetical protein